MALVLALSYSSRWEITEAARQIAIQVQKGELTPEEITDHCLEAHLTTNFYARSGFTDPHGRRDTVKQLSVMAVCLLRTLFSVILSGPISGKKN